METERAQLLAQLTDARPVASDSTTPAFTEYAGSGASASGLQPGNAPAAGVAAAPVIPSAFVYGSTPAVASMQGGQTTMTAAAEQRQLAPGEAATLQQMQGEFVNSLGNTVQDPASEEYREAWNLSARKSDERFSSMFGGDVFVRTQLDSARSTVAGMNKSNH